MRTTNYYNTFIIASPDAITARGEEPKPDSVARSCLDLIQARPYGLTSDELLFEVHARRHAVAEAARNQARALFLARPQACLRASPLVKRYGWGLHHDAHGRVAAFGVETEEYRTLAAARNIAVVAGLRSRRARQG
jgi:hypothetical protein